MNKILVRVIGLFLVPCLIAEPASASALSVPSTSHLLSAATVPASFETQALGEALISVRDIIRNRVRIGALWRTINRPKRPPQINSELRKTYEQLQAERNNLIKSLKSTVGQTIGFLKTDRVGGLVMDPSGAVYLDDPNVALEPKAQAERVMEIILTHRGLENFMRVTDFDFWLHLYTLEAKIQSMKTAYLELLLPDPTIAPKKPFRRDQRNAISSRQRPSVTQIMNGIKFGSPPTGDSGKGSRSPAPTFQDLHNPPSFAFIYRDQRRSVLLQTIQSGDISTAHEMLRIWREGGDDLSDIGDIVDFGNIHARDWVLLIRPGSNEIVEMGELTAVSNSDPDAPVQWEIGEVGHKTNVNLTDYEIYRLTSRDEAGVASIVYWALRAAGWTHEQAKEWGMLGLAVEIPIILLVAWYLAPVLIPFLFGFYILHVGLMLVTSIRKNPNGLPIGLAAEAQLGLFTLYAVMDALHPHSVPYLLLAAGFHILVDYLLFYGVPLFMRKQNIPVAEDTSVPTEYAFRMAAQIQAAIDANRSFQPPDTEPTVTSNRLLLWAVAFLLPLLLLQGLRLNAQNTAATTDQVIQELHQLPQRDPQDPYSQAIIQSLHLDGFSNGGVVSAAVDDAYAKSIAKDNAFVAYLRSQHRFKEDRAQALLHLRGLDDDGIHNTRLALLFRDADRASRLSPHNLPGYARALQALALAAGRDDLAAKFEVFNRDAAWELYQLLWSLHPDRERLLVLHGAQDRLAADLKLPANWRQTFPLAPVRGVSGASPAGFGKTIDPGDKEAIPSVDVQDSPGNTSEPPHHDNRSPLAALLASLGLAALAYQGRDQNSDPTSEAAFLRLLNALQKFSDSPTGISFEDVITDKLPALALSLGTWDLNKYETFRLTRLASMGGFERGNVLFREFNPETGQMEEIGAKLVRDDSIDSRDKKIKAYEKNHGVKVARGAWYRLVKGIDDFKDVLHRKIVEEIQELGEAIANKEKLREKLKDKFDEIFKEEFMTHHANLQDAMIRLMQLTGGAPQNSDMLGLLSRSA